jgi:ubiquinone/menaquinone biosynthesis C-methylase UbiE
MAFSQNVPAAFHTLSYQRHAEHWRAIADDGSWRRVIETWFDDSTADHWLHSRLYEAVGHLADAEGDSWLTIGDGRFGLDSVELRRRGAKTALPTDITDATLKEAKAKGLIDDYRVENAEHLSFGDQSFDFVFCKEAFHHMPRPFLALYEMLRVAKKGVVLIEPQDQRGSAAMTAIHLLKKILAGRRHFDQTRYEDSGNYIYSVTKREIEKACLGINLPFVAFKGISNIYLEGAEFQPASLKSPTFARMRALILLNGLFSRVGLSKHNVLMSVISKVDLPAMIRDRFVRNGWEFVELPRNPYAESEPRPLPPRLPRKIAGSVGKGAEPDH